MPRLVSLSRLNKARLLPFHHELWPTPTILPIAPFDKYLSDLHLSCVPQLHGSIDFIATSISKPTPPYTTIPVKSNFAQMAEPPTPRKPIFQTRDFLKYSLEDRVKSVSKMIVYDPEFYGFDTYALRPSLTLISVAPSKTTWEMEIGSHLCNKSGNLHGGAAATILDNLTSTALVTVAREGFCDGGHVSRTITMSYLRPVPMGAKVKIESEVVAAGKKTANLAGRIMLDGKVCVTCVHDKAVIPRANL